MTIGIYSITAPDGMKYIGQSINVERRMAQNRYTLQRGTHHNLALVDAWNLYGDRLIFKIEGEFPREHLNEVEQLAIDLLNTRSYNKGCVIAGGYVSAATRNRLSVVVSTAQQRPEARARVSAQAKTRWAQPGAKAKQSAALKAAFAGPEAKAKLSAAVKARWADPDIGERMRAQAKITFATPEWSKARSLQGAVQWADPAIRLKRDSNTEARRWERLREAGLLLLSPEGWYSVYLDSRKAWKQGIPRLQKHSACVPAWQAYKRNKK